MLRIIQFILQIFNKEARINERPPQRDFEIPDCDLVRDVQPGDIILYRFGGPDDFTGGVISHMTSSPYSHAEIHIKDGYDISATSNGVGFVDLYRYNLMGKKAVIGGVQPFTVDVFRAVNGLSREKRLIIESKAYKSILMPYDYFNLFAFPFLKTEKAVEMAGNDAYICSEHVAWCYDNAGIDLIKDSPESIEAPADLGRSDQVEYIGTYREGKKLSTNYANEFIDENYSDLQKLISTFMGLFSKRDEFYKGIYLNKSKLEGEST